MNRARKALLILIMSSIPLAAYSSLMMPVCPAQDSAISEDQLNSRIDSLNASIGGWPPRIKDEKERQEIYSVWARNLDMALSFKKTSGQSESSLFFLSETYRQGHNLDVQGAAEKADETISECITSYPATRMCRFSRIYFSLSVRPTEESLSKAKESLDFLRNRYGSSPNMEIERGFVHYYLHKRDNDSAINQIEYFIKAFPGTKQSEIMAELREGILKNTLKLIEK